MKISTPLQPHAAPCLSPTEGSRPVDPIFGLMLGQALIGSLLNTKGNSFSAAIPAGLQQWIQSSPCPLPVCQARGSRSPKCCRGKLALAKLGLNRRVFIAYKCYLQLFIPPPQRLFIPFPAFVLLAGGEYPYTGCFWWRGMFFSRRPTAGTVCFQHHSWKKRAIHGLQVLAGL